MSGTIRSFHAYRGTNAWEADQFARHGKLHKSTKDEEYLGHGIYFFENSQQEAYFFVRYSRGLDPRNIRVIYALIQAEKERIFDLYEPKGFEAYITAILTLAARYAGTPQALDLDMDNPVDCGLLNDMCDREGYQFVRAQFNPSHTMGGILADYGITRITRAHIQLCVRDEVIIKEAKVL